MPTSWSADELIPTRLENEPLFQRDYLHQAVCELRFPTLLELGGSKPPKAFVSALRRDYPTLELSNQVTLNLGAGTETNYAHVLRSAKHEWSVTLKSSALVVEAQRYRGYPEMLRRIEQVVEAAKDVIDSDFFTRVGLRYVNLVTVPNGTGSIHEWINPALVGSLVGQGFNGVAEFSGRLLLSKDDGGLLLQHGVKHKPLKAGESFPKDYLPDYVIDIDGYRNEVAVADVTMALNRIHDQVFSLFDWSLADKAKLALKR